MRLEGMDSSQKKKGRSQQCHHFLKKNYPPILTCSNGKFVEVLYSGEIVYELAIFNCHVYQRVELAWICLVSIGFDQKLNRPQYMV